MATYADIAAAEAARVATTIQYWVGETEGDSVIIDGVVYALTGHGSKGFTLRKLTGGGSGVEYHRTVSDVTSLTLADVANKPKYGILIRGGTRVNISGGMPVDQEFEFSNRTGEEVVIDVAPEEINENTELYIVGYERCLIKKTTATTWEIVWRNYGSSYVAEQIAALSERISEIGTDSTGNILNLLPADNATLGSGSLTITWTPRAGETYDVRVGSSEFGSQYGQSLLDGDGTYTVTIPTDGSNVYVSMTATRGDTVTTIYRTYTASGVASMQFTSPTPSSTITTSSVTFTWPVVAGTISAVRFGTAVDGNNLGTSGALIADGGSYTLNGLTDGITVYARITYSVDGGANQFAYATYTVDLPVPATLTRYTSPMASERYMGWATQNGGINWPDMTNGVPNNIVTVTNTNESGAGSLKNAMQDNPNSWIEFAPGLKNNGTIINMRSVNWATRQVVDFRDTGIVVRCTANNTSNVAMVVADFGHGVMLSPSLDGNKASNSRYVSGFYLRKGTNYWIDSPRCRNMSDDSLAIGEPDTADSADYITVTHYDVDDSCNKSFLINKDGKAPHDAGMGGHVTLNWSNLRAGDRSPRNSGGTRFHVLNTACEGKGLSCLTSVNNGGGRSWPSSVVDTKTLAEACAYRMDAVYSGQKGNCQRAQDSGSPGQSTGGQWLYTRSCHYGLNCQDDGSDSTQATDPQRGNIVNLEGAGPYPSEPPVIPYSYTLEDETTVWDARQADAGPENFIPFT